MYDEADEEKFKRRASSSEARGVEGQESMGYPGSLPRALRARSRRELSGQA